MARSNSGSHSWLRERRKEDMANTKSKTKYRYVALGDVTVHKLMTPETEAYKENSTNNYPTVSVILASGDSLAEEEVPYYVREKYDAGAIPLLSKVSEPQANRMAKEAEEGRVKTEQ